MQVRALHPVFEPLRPREKDPNHRHLGGGLLHLTGEAGNGVYDRASFPPYYAT
jgi:hypothetical protein